MLWVGIIVLLRPLARQTPAGSKWSVRTATVLLYTWGCSWLTQWHALAFYSCVELAFPKNSVLPLSSGSKGLGMRRGSVKLLGWIMGSCPEVSSETRLGPSISADDRVSSSGWPPLYALPHLQTLTVHVPISLQRFNFDITITCAFQNNTGL